MTAREVTTFYCNS